jgi:hypothetical protein
MLRNIVLIAAMLMTVHAAFGGEAQRTDSKQPSIIYYGNGVNERVSESLYWEGETGALAKQRAKDATRQRATGYGAISAITGNPRTSYVSGYTRQDGTRVNAYYRSHR